MAKAKFIDSAKELEQQAKQLFERIKKTHTDMGTTLQEVRRAEGKLIEKEKAAEKERIETERAERLRELLASEGDLAFHVGEPDEVQSAVQQEEKTAAAEPPAKPREELSAAQDEPAPEKETMPMHKEEMQKEEPPKEAPQKEEPQKTAEKPAKPEPEKVHAQQQKPAGPVKSVEQKPVAEPRRQEPRQRTQSGYQAQPQAQTAYQQRSNQQRPAGQGGYQQRPAVAPIPAAGKEQRSFDANKSAHTRTRDDERNKAKNKKTLMKESAPMARGWDEDGAYGSKKKKKQQAPIHKPEPVKIEKAVITSETITVKELSEKIGKPAAEIIKKLFILGIMATINQEIDFDTCSLIASDYGIELEHNVAKTFEEVLQESSDEVDESTELVERPPVVTIMGHVDHGKTSLLDAIRNSSVTEGEAGGITQHIGAYTVTCNGRTITFIDTPGHEAFTSMRARGAQVTDIVILVVAADDGIMPQTVEAINHAKAANVPIIVAINKMDRETANPERVKQQLTEHGLVSEEWGGDTICVPVSALTGQGIEDLLESINLVAEVKELKANPHRRAKGAVIEARLDKGQGPVATILVQKGTLHQGDVVIAGTSVGRVRVMRDDQGAILKEAGPSMPVEITGLTEVPAAGDLFDAVEDEKLARELADRRAAEQKEQQFSAYKKVTLDNLFSQIAEGERKELAIIVKADVQGSAEAVKQSLEKISNDEVRVRVIHAGVGAINKSDVMLANAGNAIIIGFNVRPDPVAKEEAAQAEVELRMYRVIYDAINDVTDAMKGMLAPKFREVELGRAEVRSVFKISSAGTIAGCYVLEGKVTRAAKIRLVRDGIVITEDEIDSLRRFKDDVKEVAQGYECGIGLDKFSDIKEGDIFEAFIMEEYRD